jgi:CBS domain-containing protein
MALLARDVMERHVISLAPEDPVSNAYRLFVEEGIHGAPVLDDLGRLLGVVSSLDLLRNAAEIQDLPEPDPRDLRELHELGTRLFPVRIEEGSEAEPSVADVMTSGTVHVRPEATIAKVARTLRENQVHRVVVVDDGRVCGIISSFDLLALLEKNPPA